MDDDDLSPEDRQRLAILAVIVRDLPGSLWSELRTRARQAYSDVFHQTLNDPNVIDEQRIDLLLQARHFRMEKVFKALAEAHGLACSPTLLAENNRRYVYAAGGSVGLTQAYVPAIGDMPKPARFRERHSAINRLIADPGFDFGLVAPELLQVKAFYGLIAHNPVGKRFTEADQTLGMIQLCVPVSGFGTWAAQFTVQEIVSAYEAAAPAAKTERGPTWKPQEDKKKGSGEV